MYAKIHKKIKMEKQKNERKQYIEYKNNRKNE